MRNFVKKLAIWFSANSESGVTAIEYGLIAALIAVVIIVGVTAVGTDLEIVFTTISGHTRQRCIAVNARRPPTSCCSDLDMGESINSPIDGVFGRSVRAG